MEFDPGKIKGIENIKKILKRNTKWKCDVYLFRMWKTYTQRVGFIN